MAVGGSLVICSSFIRTFSPIDDKVANFSYPGCLISQLPYWSMIWRFLFFMELEEFI